HSDTNTNLRFDEMFSKENWAFVVSQAQRRYQAYRISNYKFLMYGIAVANCDNRELKLHSTAHLSCKLALAMEFI
ncbi:MAG TPA: hypothetical protein PKD51_12265, partial [Saprospiraceae bacterium]|nr:hypothetical protein [Saprospiraceae bacterium]HMU05728.1 hypothetical protein [Saprospiraceae bacterium]